ncbi:hypothetical protein IAU60_006569 [Kwoniella sp. DSM 27419]
MSHQAGSSGDKRKTAGSSTQKNKFYKYSEKTGGRGGGGRGGRGGGAGGRGAGRGGSSGARGRPQGAPGEQWDVEEVKKKKSSMGRYKTAPLPDMLTSPGISVTTWKDKERLAEAELIDLLEQLADELYPETIEQDGETEQEGDDLDFDELLKRDLESMATDNKSKRFQICAHSSICVTYINVLPPLSPYVLVRRILEQAESSGKSPLRFCKRLIPISATCGATIHQLSETASGVVAEAFKTDDDKPLKVSSRIRSGLTRLQFAIDTNTRMSDRLQRMEMITTIAEQVTKLDKGHSVDLANPDKTILVELHKNTLGMVVVEDYERFKKYNPGGVASQAAASKQPSGPSSSTSRIAQQAESSTAGKGTPAHVYRQRRAEAVAAGSESALSAKTDVSSKSVADGPIAEQEDGQVGELEPELGEVLEDPKDELKEGWVERIEDGGVTRVKEDD